MCTIRFGSVFGSQVVENKRHGEMAEWFKAHAWKACVGNTTVSSNLTLSAIRFQIFAVNDTPSFNNFCASACDFASA
jgi:hypothetical protein